MMDYIYSKEENWPLPDMSPLGRAVFEYTTTADASAGVRARREFIANLLDEQSIRQSGSAVLAVASGHLREASMSSAVRRRRFGRFLALDADSASLKEVQDCYGRYGVETQAADIRKMLWDKFKSVSSTWSTLLGFTITSMRNQLNASRSIYSRCFVLAVDSSWQTSCPTSPMWDTWKPTWIGFSSIEIVSK